MPASPTRSATCPWPARGASEGLEQLAQLALAPHERREPAVGLDLQARARLVRGHDFPGGDRLGLALDDGASPRERVSK